MVRVAVKPSRRDASCCRVLVMKAGVGCLVRLPRRSSPTVYWAPARPCSRARASASVLGSSFLPDALADRRAVNFLPAALRVASTFSAADLPPQEGAQLVAHQPVQHTA